MLKNLNNIIENFLDDCGVVDSKDFVFLDRLIEIFQRHYKEQRISGYSKKISFDKCYRYSYNFLKSINPGYAAYLEEQYKNGLFKHEYDSSYGDDIAFCGYVDGNPIIYLPPSGTIEDSYAITHEIIHSTTLIDEEFFDTRTVYCELFSLLAEELQRDYFDKIKIPYEYKLNSLLTLEAIDAKNKRMLLERELIDIFIDKGFISPADLLFIAQQNYDYSLLINQHLQNIVDVDGDLAIDFEQRYVIGYLLGCYMLDRIDSNPKNIREFFELNESINSYCPDYLIDYLELDLKDGDFFDLTDDSYRKIEEGYVKRLKKY